VGDLFCIAASSYTSSSIYRLLYLVILLVQCTMCQWFLVLFLAVSLWVVRKLLVILWILFAVYVSAQVMNITYSMNAAVTWNKSIDAVADATGNHWWSCLCSKSRQWTEACTLWVADGHLRHNLGLTDIIYRCCDREARDCSYWLGI